MDNRVTLLPAKVYVKLETPRVVATVDVPQVPSTSVERHVPVIVAPGKPGPPGKDGAVIGGAVIDDARISSDHVWSSQHTHDNDVAVVDSLTPDIDLVLLFDNALT